MFGQVRIEFIFGVVIFAVIIFYIVTQTNTLFSALLFDSRLDYLKAEATNTIKILVEDRGEPANWDMLAVSSPGSIKRVGLANEPFFLSRSKVLNLSYNCSNSDVYKNLLWSFSLKAYRLRVYNSTSRILLCGFDSLEPAAVTETRYVYIDNGFGTVVLDLW
jgi:hypothetical protein